MPPSSAFTPPPFAPTVPVPDYILRVAQAYPDREVVCYLQDVTSAHGVSATSITWRQFLADVWSRADYLVEVTGLDPRPIGSEPVVVGLLAESNYDFLVDLVAMFMLRWQALLISVRNSHAAILHLVNATDCQVLVVDAAISHLHPDIAREGADSAVTPIVVVRPPVSTDRNRDGLTRASSYLGESGQLSAAELRGEADGGLIFLHTSGSTGHPKPIAWSHAFFIQIIATAFRDRAKCNDDVLYTCFPIFHAGGMSICLPHILGSGTSFVCVDAWKSVSADTILRHLRILKHRKVDVLLTPSMLEDVADYPDGDGAALLSAQNTVFWGGAPLREGIGNFLVQKGVRLITWGGMTEVGAIARASYEDGADPMDWSYMRFLDYYQYHWSPIEGDTLSRYNLVISPLHATPPVINSSDPIGFAAPDGWIQHPDPKKAHLWKLAGRLDDVTVLSNGEKTDNKQLEGLLCESPHIHQAIIFGSGRFVNGAIVSPPAGLLKSHSERAVAQYLDKIWPHIDDYVNNTVPAHSRLLRGMVLITNPDRPFLLSDKGSVKTKASLALYTDDIERAYDALERGTDSTITDGQPVFPLSSSSSYLADTPDSSVLAFVQTTVSDALGRDLAPDDDFFRNGMDSLLATKLRTSLAGAFRRAGIPAPVPRNVVYAYPTCAALAHYLRILAGGQPEQKVCTAAPAPSLSSVQEMIEKYSRDFPVHMGTRPVPDDGDVYAVTGTTGALGAAYVAHLLGQSHVKKVFLLNRGHASCSMASRQEAAFEDKGLDLPTLRKGVKDGRIEYVQVELGEERLGLRDEVYSKICSEITHIVHIAWLINFNLFVPFFEPHVAGVRSLIDFALSSPLERPPHVTFISSISTVGRWPFASPVPEAPLNSPEFSIPQGYSYSKYISEQILQSALAQRPGLRVAVVRCGQLSGTLTTGAWARSEYIPRLIRSADALGMVPAGIAPVRWLPVNVAATILFREVEYAAAQPAPGPIRYYTLDNVASTPWQAVVRALADMHSHESKDQLRARAPLKEVPMGVFLDAVRGDASSAAFEVAEYLEELLVVSPLPRLDTTEARRAAGDLVECEITEGLLRMYVRYACT